jgi:hypothetical protein
LAQKQRTLTKDEELLRLSHEKAKCIDRAKHLAKEHDRAWTQEITQLAEIIEKEYILLDQQWLIPSISADISRIYMDNDIPIWNNIGRYIPERFKSNDQEHSSIQSPSWEGDYLEESENTMLYSIAKRINEIPTSRLADKIQLLEKAAKKARARAALEHIALHHDDNASFADQINDSKEQDRKHVTIDRPVPHGSLMFDAITRKIARWQSVQERVFEFPPEILSKDQQYADALDAADVWMDPILDLKYSKCLPDWLKAESYRDIYGKHAAGVMSYSVTNLCANCSDEKTKEWVRMEPRYAITHSVYECLQCNTQKQTLCPVCKIPMRESHKPQVGWVCPECEGTTPLRRNLTREQIGDKSSIIMDIAENFLMRIPDAAAFCNWYREWLEQRVSGRKSRLSSDLSERA